MLREDQATEFKREFVDDIKLAAIAFANSDGGTIYVGIHDDGTVCGVKNPDEEALKIQNALRDSILPDVMMFVRCTYLDMEGKTVLRLEVRRGTRRPYFLKGKGIRPEGVYVRQGPATVPASFDVIRRMLVETTGEHFEAGVSLVQNLTFDFAADYFSKRGVAFGEAQKNTLRLINKDKLYTNLALLLSDQCEHSIKAAVFQGTHKLVFRDRAEFSGSLFRQLEEAYAFILKHNNLKATLEGLYRVDTYDFPLEAVREGLLNAIVHRDYSTSGPILISIFDDRMEIINQGGLMPKMTVEDVRNGVSDSRNKTLASIFYRLKLVEAYGTGYDRIDSAYESSGKAASIAVTENSFKLTLPNVNFSGNVVQLPRSAAQHQQIAASAVGRREPLASRENEVISLCRRLGQASRKEIAAKLGISQTPALLLVQKMLENGTLRRIGSGPRTRYALAAGTR